MTDKDVTSSVTTADSADAATATTHTSPPRGTSESMNPLKRLFHKSKAPERNPEDPPAYKKKESISDSGPYILVKDPETGKEVLRKNPHWPNEDSWREVERSKGEWAMGGEMGSSKKDFGGTVG